MSSTPSIIRASTDVSHKTFMNLRARALVNLSRFVSNPRAFEMHIFNNNSNMTTYSNKVRQILHGFIVCAPHDKEDYEWWASATDDGICGRDTAIKKVAPKKQLPDIFRVELIDYGDKRYALSRCGKCGSTDVNVEARQVRSGDEGMSVFATCRKCGHNWTQR